MLTLQKLKIYEKFNGDIDAWTRSSKRGAIKNMDDNDWFLIEDLRQGLFLISSGLASPEFKLSVEQRLLSSTADDQTRNALRELAKRKTID